MLALLLTAVCLSQSVRVTSPADAAKAKKLTSSQLLSELADEMVPALFKRYPWLAYERGFPQANPLAYSNYGTEAFSAWRDEVAGYRRSLGKLSERELSDQEWVAYSATSAWVLSQELLVESRSLERWDAAAYVLRVERMLFALRASEYVRARTRLIHSIQLLEGLPAYWKKAQESLVSPAEIWRNEAVDRLVDLGLAIEVDLVKTFSGLKLDRKTTKRFEEAVERAVANTDRFRNWLLSSRAPRGDETGNMGAASWERLVQVVSGTDLTAPRLKSRLLREVAALNRKLGNDWKPRPASESQQNPKRLIKSIQTASKLATSLGERAGLLRVEPHPELVVRLQEGRPVPRQLARLWPGKRLEDALFLEIGSPSWSPNIQNTRATQLNPRALATLGIRYGWAGESRLRRATTQAAHPVARFLWNRSVFEGWGLFALDWISRVDWVENPFLEDENLKTEATRAFLLEAVRLLAAIEIHVEGLSVEAAADAFRRRSRFDEESSLIEAQSAHRDPLRGIGYLGLLELRLLEAELGRELTSREALQEALESVLSTPHLRPFDIRRRLGAQRPR